METTFMTIHNLSPNANILFASESIVDILGFLPHQVLGKSCFDYFHPDEVPFAKNVHSRGVELDKAAVLSYARIKGSGGEWISCECVFSIVYDVLVACTSIYKGDNKSQKRQAEAPAVRRIFSGAPKDPRYHMLQHLSAKFQNAPPVSVREPRAALILNRFTRTLTVMFATNAVAGILGVTPEQLNGKSFYECIEQNCLPDAIRCLESAKANDSIAYLRFWYRDPRRPAEVEQAEREASNSSDDSDDGGVLLEPMSIDGDSPSPGPSSSATSRRPALGKDDRTDSTDSSDLGEDSSHEIFDNIPTLRPRFSGSSISDGRGSVGSRRTITPSHDIELEAVVSCTSDGLVVILRRARPLELASHPAAAAATYSNGVFAAPWGVDSIPPQVPVMQPGHYEEHMQGTEASTVSYHAGPPVRSFMDSIREVAVFAWSLTGINGNIAKYARGKPAGEAVPPTGYPVWDPNATNVPEYPPGNQAHQKWVELNRRMGQRTNEPENQTDQLPYVHYRQEQLLRQQYGHDTGPMGSDKPGSSALEYLGDYIGDDGFGPGHFPRQDPHQASRTFDIANPCDKSSDFQGRVYQGVQPSKPSRLMQRRPSHQQDTRYSPYGSRNVSRGPSSGATSRSDSKSDSKNRKSREQDEKHEETTNQSCHGSRYLWY